MNSITIKDDTKPLQTSSLSYNFNLGDYGYSVNKALQSLFPEAKKGDVIIFAGTFGTPVREAVKIGQEAVSDKPSSVLDKISAFYKAYANTGVVCVIVVPETGIPDSAPYKDGIFFNVSPAADATSMPVQPRQHIPLRRYAAEKLLRALNIATDEQGQVDLTLSGQSPQQLNIDNES